MTLELGRELAPPAKCARSYWFKCPECKFEWTAWLRNSIVFVSLVFVRDRCPNCRTGARAYK